MNIPKYILVIAAIIIISIIGMGIYFVGQISSTYPPIETYKLNYSKLQFENKLKSIELKDEYKVSFTDTTGVDPDSEYNYYFNILDKQTNDKYLLTFKADKTFFKDEQVKLSLIGLTNEMTNKVVYEIDSDSEKVKEMFENKLLLEIEK
ncbi:hypothetical protein A7A78_08595 [Aequorivita soesokkakensis]|jgi:hypothetical protein|uniref:Uncharacterized protein n=1 Tax=Aequorivita soesokkakensis TaxID=1385699 RepID=A0A1A9LGQ8_9FLAO|nr:hypothetical protein [Aequorivita soesokkakensis]OAD92287.1 hypothetical protein A7A78_08595 [Aequorivita soesokkakensis]